MIAMTGCSGSDDEDNGGNGGGGGGNDAIVGSWKLYGDLVDGELVPEDIEECDQTIYKFQNNGKLTVTDKYCDEPSDVYNINWEKEGNLYKFVAEGQAFEAYYITFSEDGKYAYVSDTPDDMQYAEVWKRS